MPYIAQQGSVYRPKLLSLPMPEARGFPEHLLTTDELAAQRRETYEGPLEVGEDLMSFDIGEGGVTVRRDPDRK